MTLTAMQLQKSTNVRTSGAPRTIRWAFAALDVVAPTVSARWAEYLWFRLPRPVTANRPTVPGGTAFEVDLGGRRIAGTRWGAGPTVYLIHGWAGHAGHLRGFVEPLLGQGYRVVAFDAPSHGASGPGADGPRSSTAPEMVEALAAVVAAQGPAHALVAHSLGATATAVALCDGLAADRVVFLAPMASPAAYAGRLTAALGAGDRTRHRLTRRIEERTGVPFRHFDVPELGRDAAMLPTLIIHDHDDASTPVGDSRAIAAAWPGAHLHLTTGKGHRRILRDPDVIAEVTRFVSGPRPPARPGDGRPGAAASSARPS